MSQRSTSIARSRDGVREAKMERVVSFSRMRRRRRSQKNSIISFDSSIPILLLEENSMRAKSCNAHALTRKAIHNETERLFPFLAVHSRKSQQEVRSTPDNTTSLSLACS